MEFVETPTFWCQHVDPTACTNCSTRTFERRPPETREILPLPFPPFSFSSLFSLRTVSLFSLFSLFSFLFAFLFIFLISHFTFLPFSPHFLFSFLSFSIPFGRNHSFGQRRKLPPNFLKLKVWLSLFHIYSLFYNSLFMTSFTQVVHREPWDSFPHMAHCEP